MALNSINTNVAAYFAQQNINSANNMTSTSIGRLSSGNRIVRAADDVAAMSVGTSMRTQVTTLRQGLQNASQGSSMLQVADGALSKIQDMLLRQKSLATQATSGSLTATERGFLNQEFQNLTQEIDRLVQNTNFNGVNLLGGTLGSSMTLVGLDATAATFDPTGNNAQATASTSAASIKAIGAVNTSTGAELNGNAAPGEIQFVDTDGATELTDGAYQSLPGSLYGQIEKFELSNVVYGAGTGTATLNVTINGTVYSGQFTDTDTNVVVRNGNTRIDLGTTALDIDDEGAADATISQLYEDFADTSLMHTGTISGVNFTDTRLEGVTGNNTLAGVAMLRTDNPNDVSITNFRYVGNSGAANTSILSVEVGGETWTAATVNDVIADGNVISFENGTGEALLIDFNGLTTDFVNIRTDVNERNEFINALNAGFADVGGGVDFALGTERTDKLTVSIGNSSSASLYDNQSLNVNTVAEAQAAGEALNGAIDRVTSIRADVGALQSRFEFASANIEISLQNQDAARGNLLDTDIAAESSAYATAQVQLQAGIAVLAQANLLPQNLLKLIG